MRIDEDAPYPLLPAIPGAPGRDLVPYREPPVPATDGAPDAGTPVVVSPLQRIIGDLDVRRLSPRQAVGMSMDLYISGVLSWEEYAMVAFQPELQPAYDRTVGALIGQRAEPDRRRDFVALWEDRLRFERRYNAEDPKLIERTEHIANLLRRIDAPTHALV